MAVYSYTDAKASDIQMRELTEKFGTDVQSVNVQPAKELIITRLLTDAEEQELAAYWNVQSVNKSVIAE